MKYENWIFGKNGALLRAAAHGNLDLVRELASAGANVNAISPNGYTPLHRAAQKGHPDIVRFLLDNGASRDVRSVDGQIPESLAIKEGHSGISAILARSS